MDEFSFINSIRQDYYKQPTLIKGIGDDAAVFRQTTKDIVTAVDTFVEEVHFSRKTMPSFYIGYRALAANVSDLAAMCASPAFYLVSIVIPKSWSNDELIEMFSGMKALAKDYQMDLIGGDTVTGKELSISITVIGYVNNGKASYRNLAREGDLVFVTGTLGCSQAGFHMLMNPGDYINKAYFIKRHQRPTPRIGFANGLESLGRVALNDISDGIANEAAEIAVASDVNITLYPNQIPVGAGFDQFSTKLQHQWKYFGGEDFELLGTVSESDIKTVKKIAEKTNVDVRVIGYVGYSGANNNQVFLEDGKNKTVLNKNGYIHFK